MVCLHSHQLKKVMVLVRQGATRLRNAIRV